MAQLTINVPDAIAVRVMDAIATKLNYNGNKLENETKAQFAKRMVIREVKGWVANIEADSAYVTQKATSESEIDLT